jgi:glutaryl-CoA dehydrogenase
MAEFNGIDLYGFDSDLSEEERMIRETVRSFVSERVIPILPKHNRAGTFPTELVAPMAEMGLLGAGLQGYGCAGLNNVAYGLIMQELERGDSGVRSFASVQGGLVMYPIHAFGSEEQKNRWLPPMARGEAIGCFGLTEPDFGSNPAGMLTKAEEEDGRYVLTGTKMWITNGAIADVAVVWAKLKGEIRGFLVEKGTPGYRTSDVPTKFSLRASVTSELHFDRCRIPKANLLPGAEGLKGPLKCLTQARYGIAWGAVGSAMACFCEALDYAKSRIQFGKPIASFQLVQKKLADMATEITKAQALALKLGRMKDAGAMTFAQVSMAKRNNVAMALETARTCRDVLGASGITDEYQVGRHLCNLESVSTYEGTHDIHTLILGQALTGIAAFE